MESQDSGCDITWHEEENFVAELLADDGDLEPPDGEIVVEAGERTYRFGEWCQFEYLKETDDDGDELVEVPFAEGVWPIAVYEHVDEEDHGVRFLYRSVTGEMKWGTISADAFGAGHVASKRASECASEGVQVMVEQGKEFAFALGTWLQHTDDPPVVYVTETPGWHDGGSVYVNGDEVIGGDDDWHADIEVPSIKRRSSRSGLVETWTEKVDELVDTPALRASVGVSLAGALVGLCHPHSFLVHLHGASSSGKSTAAELAASVWGSMSDMKNTWYGTTTSFENLAEVGNGACLVLDELGQFPYGDKRLAEVIYNLASDQGKNRSTRSGHLREQRSWDLTGLSTGEISMKEAVGQHRKGGQDVRMIDVCVDKGEVTRSREHSNEIKRMAGAIGTMPQYGVAGDIWVKYLVHEANPQAIADQIRGLHEDLVDEYGDGNAETDRMLQNLAPVGVAMLRAHEIDFEYAPPVVPWGKPETYDTLEWFAERAVGDREAQTPNERALMALWDQIETEQHHFPTAEQVKDSETHRTIWGIRKVESYGKDVEVFLSESHFKASDVQKNSGVGARSFLQWCVEEDHAEKVGRKRIGGIQKTWYRLEGRPQGYE